MRLGGPRAWQRRGRVALLGVMVAFFLWPLLEPGRAVLDSDWPAYAMGGMLAAQRPAQLYDRPTQMRVEAAILSGASLVNREQGQYLSFDQGPWIALLAAPFAALGPELGGRLWIELELVALATGLVLATTATRRGGALAAMASVPTGLVATNATLDGLVVLGLGLACYLWQRSRLAAGLALTLSLAKPQLVLPLAAGLLVARQFRAVAGWTAGGAGLVAVVAAVHASWLAEWPRFVAHGAGVLGYELGVTGVVLRWSGLGSLAVPLALAVLVAGLAVVLSLARRRTADTWAAAAILIAGGFVLSPHALSADTALLALALAVSSRATPADWVVLSALALGVAVLHALPISSVVGIGLAAYVMWRLSTSPPHAPLPAAPAPPRY